MNSDDFGRLIYLVLLGAVIASWFFVQNRTTLSKSVQQAAIWALIFVGFVAGYGLWENIKSDHAIQSETGDGIVLVRNFDGHYYATLTISGTEVDFVVDTGATDVVLTKEDAQRLGIDLDDLHFLGSASTANGIVKTARVTLTDIEFSGIKTARLTAYVNEGEMSGSLLGMAYLGRMARIEIVGDEMYLYP